MIYRLDVNNTIPFEKIENEIFKTSIITAHRMCINAMLQCMFLYIYIVHVHAVDQNIFGHGVKLHTVLLYIDSIFTIQDFTSSNTE